MPANTLMATTPNELTPAFQMFVDELAELIAEKLLEENAFALEESASTSREDEVRC
jgi:hypothetical protein